VIRGKKTLKKKMRNKNSLKKKGMESEKGE